jgi:hypothetical protein
VGWYIHCFNPYKRPGTDGIFTALVQEGWEVCVPYFIRIFHACLAAGYVQIAWHQVKVVFIPKPGRNNYSGSKDYRPISLTSFFLKTMERLVDRHWRDKTLVLSPLHPNHHAYQAGKLTETAFHEFVFWVDKALNKRDTALGDFRCRNSIQ